jgi:uncharacterized protein (DUF1800 family)
MALIWSLENAAHLLRRSGFGPKLEEIVEAYDAGLDATIEKLFDFDPKLPKYPGTAASPPTLDRLQTTWLQRMIKTKSPLLEKLVLFWHSHFATGISKVIDPRLMFEQNATLRKHAAGKFLDLVLAIAKDPAMVIWLDNASNVKGSPNLNFARELMEIYTCGVYSAAGSPNYTEFDVKEAARCFTGWTVEHGTFVFKPDQHDFGWKVFRGVSGNLTGEIACQILVADALTARRIAWKLFSYFARPIALGDPLLQPLVQAYQQSGGSIRAMLETLFRMEAFYAPAAQYARVKSPIEFVVGSLRMLGGKFSKKKKNSPKVAWMLYQLAQVLYEPPSVFGWDEGKAWITTNTLMARARIANVIALARPEAKPYVSWKLENLLGPPSEWLSLDAETVIARTLGQLLVGNVSAATGDALVEYMKAAPHGQQQPFVLDAATADTKVRGLVALVLSSPEYQFA